MISYKFTRKIKWCILNCSTIQQNGRFSRFPRNAQQTENGLNCVPNAGFVMSTGVPTGIK